MTHLPQETLQELAQVIPLRQPSELDRAFLAKENAREVFMSLNPSQAMLLAVSTYAVRCAAYAVLVLKEGK